MKEVYSTTLNFRALNDVNQIPYTGEMIRGWFLNQIGLFEPDLSEILHKGNSLRPYTVSPIFAGSKIARSLKTGDYCWLRITTLSQEFSEFIEHKFIKEMQSIIKITNAELNNPGLLLELQSDKNHSGKLWEFDDNYQSLLTSAFQDKNNKIELNFYTPTSIKVSDTESGIEKDLPLPIPDLIFKNLIDTWEQFSSIKLPTNLREFIRIYVAVNEHRISTQRCIFSSNKNDSYGERAIVGFVGNVKLIFLPPKNKEIKNDTSEYITFTKALASFGQYCGVGHRTPIGFGQMKIMYTR
ncbi:MAG: hypothetical protein CL609_23305 [Anaerolineaceae bacterium]|nr:hypothetical protein [Anaerolineaceae bacterium]